MKFKDYFSLKHILFALLLFAVLIPFVIRDSNKQVRVSFDASSVSISSKKYSMTVRYDDINSASLTDLAEPGEELADAYDDDILHAGVWKNDVWGEYHIAADLDTTNCIKIQLKDGRIFVFSSVDNDTTAAHFETLQSHLS